MTQAEIKYIRSLSLHKYRKAHGAYLVEGHKSAAEWLHSDQAVQIIVALPEWLDAYQDLVKRHPEATVLPVKETALQKVSALKTAQSVLLVVKQAAARALPETLGGWNLFLEDIKDPGNMGAIIRIADWFGISHLFHTPHCVEIYNPKVIQATMGSLLRVSIHTLTKEELVAKVLREDYPLYAATLDGEELVVRKEQPQKAGIIALGNESTGLSSYICRQAAQKLRIKGGGNAESLNVAVAAGIFCAALT